MENLQNNELMVNNVTGEMLAMPTIIQETEDYRVVQNADGTFSKQAKYKKILTYSDEDMTEEKTIELFGIKNNAQEDNPLVKPMKSEKDTVFTLANVMTEPYTSFDETTAQSNTGVVTYLESTDGHYYVTSSKTVYFNLMNILDTFGYPNTDTYKPIKVKVTHSKSQFNNIQIGLAFAGFDK